MYKNTKRIIKTFKNSKKIIKRIVSRELETVLFLWLHDERKGKRKKNNSDAAMVYNNGIMVNKTTGCEGGKDKNFLFIFIY